MNIVIREEEERDHTAVETLTREAFWNLYRPGCDEHYLVHIMRSHPDYLADLSHVAECDGEIVGSIMYTASCVRDGGGERVETATFGPLCVHPRYQRRGIGTKLIEHTRRLVVERGYPAIIILGDPHNYCKHGFLNGRDCGVAAVDGKYPLGLLVLELQKGVFAGRQWRFTESTLFHLDQKAVEDYDRTLPVKEKRHQYSQDLFRMMIRAYVEAMD